MKPTHSTYDLGSIYWLPAYDKVPLEHLYATVHIDPGCFDHPVVILWVNLLKTEAIVLLITSFKGTDLLLKHPHNTRARSLHLPIYPSNAHPDNGSLLFLRDDARLPRNSYVKTEHLRKFKTVLLVPTRHQVCTLRKDSYDELIKHIAFRSPVTKSHPKTHGTHKEPQSHGEWPDLVTPTVGGRDKSPQQERFVVHVKQTPPPRQIQQPLSTPCIQPNAFRPLYTPGYRTERTPLLQSVRPESYVTQRPYTQEAPSRAANESCAGGEVMVIFVLGIIVWVVCWKAYG